MADVATWLPGAAGLIAAARAELPQKNGLCGPFTALAALRAAGFAVADQDEVALAAGSVDHEGGPPSWPEGERGRADFRVRLPASADPDASGTSAAGVALAVERLSGGALAAVPASGDWTPDAVQRLLTGLGRLDGVAVIANVATAEFGAHDTPERALWDYLDGGLPPLWSSRWRVGHFVLLTGLVTGSGGAVVSVMDTYPSLGDNGLHWQTVERVAAALNRDGMTPGGVLAVVADGDAAAARRAVTVAGLRQRLWDNGSPAPESAG
ncbi:hypothetical protein EWH70_15460 [Amycolatopsis suaedae]|uniref:Peptidase C39-like domain-containing protein n=1 Tax=Amycolatopsis suaedae TaxID=2510978 RepID=A0A4Q7J7U9_9PSEU|nr:hypothetical protein EWH70_15460 [Amycolatopsis suaedae]